MPKFRARPIVVEAVPAKAAMALFLNHWTALPAWLAYAYQSGVVRPSTAGIALAAPGGGTELATPDDWIVRGLDGTLSRCDPAIFRATYEPEPEAAPC